MTTPTSISSATLWSALDVALGQGLRFAITVVLARLLTPDEFGTIALLALFVGIAGVFVDSGLGLALIQRQDITNDDESTVFWFNVASATAVAALLALAAPAISAFFDKPILVPLTRVLAANIVVGAFGMVHRSLFTKQLAFKPLMVVGAVSTVVSGVAAIVCAFAGYGVWSLAWQTLVAGLISTLMLWILSPWRPRLVFRMSSARRLFGFGGYMLASALLEIVYSRAYTMLIGKFHGTADLGQFSRAESTAALPTTLFTSTIARVAFPALSTMSHDPVRVREAMRIGLQTAMLINAPAMLGLAAVADPFIVTVYGEAWRPAVPILQILCLGGVLMPLHVLNLQVLMALGRSDLFFRLEVIKKVVGVPILIGASLLGVTGLAWGIVLAGAVALVINTSQTSRLVGYGIWGQLRDVAPAIATAAVMAGIVWPIARMDNLPIHLRLLAMIGSGAVIYGGGGWLLRLPGFPDIRRLLVRKSPRQL